jgi:hypothetical protein
MVFSLVHVPCSFSSMPSRRVVAFEMIYVALYSFDVSEAGRFLLSKNPLSFFMSAIKHVTTKTRHWPTVLTRYHRAE